MVHDHDAAAEAVVRNRLYVLAAVVDHTNNQAAGAVRAANDHVLAAVVVRNAGDVLKVLATLFRSILLKNLFLPPARR